MKKISTLALALIAMGSLSMPASAQTTTYEQSDNKTGQSVVLKRWEYLNL